AKGASRRPAAALAALRAQVQAAKRARDPAAGAGPAPDAPAAVADPPSDAAAVAASEDAAEAGPGSGDGAPSESLSAPTAASADESPSSAPRSIPPSDPATATSVVVATPAIRPRTAGAAFPTCVSPNALVRHVSPLPTDAEAARIPAPGDVLRIELAAHVDGFIAQAATTVVVPLAGPPLSWPSPSPLPSPSQGPRPLAAAADGRAPVVVRGTCADAMTAAAMCMRAILRQLGQACRDEIAFRRAHAAWHAAADASSTSPPPPPTPLTNWRITETARIVADAYGCVPLQGTTCGSVLRGTLDGPKAMVFHPVADMAVLAPSTKKAAAAAGADADAEVARRYVRATGMPTNTYRIGDAISLDLLIAAAPPSYEADAASDQTARGRAVRAALGASTAPPAAPDAAATSGADAAVGSRPRSGPRPTGRTTHAPVPTRVFRREAVILGPPPPVPRRFAPRGRGDEAWTAPAAVAAADAALGPASTDAACAEDSERYASLAADYPTLDLHAVCPITLGTAAAAAAGVSATARASAALAASNSPANDLKSDAARYTLSEVRRRFDAWGFALRGLPDTAARARARVRLGIVECQNQRAVVPYNVLQSHGAVVSAPAAPSGAAPVQPMDAAPPSPAVARARARYTGEAVAHVLVTVLLTQDGAVPLTRGPWDLAADADSGERPAAPLSLARACGPALLLPTVPTVDNGLVAEAMPEPYRSLLLASGADADADADAGVV
ncbi:hypothetical protein CXG81DRAFT_27060, partial [Caulochytrium protostelioides]